MTGERPDSTAHSAEEGNPGDSRAPDDRRARIETDHADGATARRVAAALAPDNTESMATAVEATRVVTTIERPTTAGLQSTVDDYVCNLQVGAQLATGTTDAANTKTEATDTTETTDTTDTTDT